MKKSIYKVAILGAVVLGCLVGRQQAYNGPTPSLSIEILADTNRDGTVDSSDSTGKQAWTKTLGAIYTVNYDADGGLRTTPGDDNTKVPDSINFGDDGYVNFEDFKIESEADKADIASIKIKVVADMPADARVFLVVGDPLKPARDREVEMRAVHIYKKVKSKTEDPQNTAIWGGGHATNVSPKPWTDGDTKDEDIEVTKWVNPNCPTFEDTRDPGSSDQYFTFGVEGIMLAGMTYYPPPPAGGRQFDGLLHLKVEIRASDGTTVCGGDNIVMRVAPWLTLSADRPSEQVWALDNGNNNLSFRRPGAVTPTYVGLTDSGQLQEVPDAIDMSPPPPHKPWRVGFKITSKLDTLGCPEGQPNTSFFVCHTKSRFAGPSTHC